jgi:hypothetical protein
MSAANWVDATAFSVGAIIGLIATGYHHEKKKRTSFG